MGIDDRDYMQHRYRQRQGLSAGKTQWNDKRARQELLRENHKKAVPIGSASWIESGGTGGNGGGWFDNATLRFERGRIRPRSQDRSDGNPAQKWIILLSALTVLIPAYREAKRGGWLPDSQPEIAFPSSGTVTIDAGLDPSSATSRMRVTTDQANAVVQLMNRDTDRHVISVYVRREDDVTVPVPPGTYRMKVIEGNKWHGTTDYFGQSTTFETVIPPMIFTRRQGSGINLHRTPAGTLRTSINFSNPKPLD